jgi:hypothetical protein
MRQIGELLADGRLIAQIGGQAVRPRPKAQDQKRVERRRDIENLGHAVAFLRRHGTHEELQAATLALWCIGRAAGARGKANAAEHAPSSEASKWL